MKKTFYIGQLCGAAMLAAGALTSCSDDFMERTPLDKISDASYWKSSNDLKLYVNNLYNRNDLLSRDDGWGGPGPFDDDAQNGADTEIRYNYNTRMNGENTIPDDGGGWGNGDWEALRDINYFMDHYKQVEEVVGFDAVKQYVGEALFFRSLFYFGKLRRFGDLPWAATTVSAQSDVLFAARLPRNEVVTNIMADLDNAVSYLPARAGGSWNGRVTKETAMALQARIALYEGTWEKYHANDAFKAQTNKSQEFLQKAADVSGALIDMAAANGYPAVYNTGKPDEDYANLFNQNDYSTNKEVLFWRKYDASVFKIVWQGYSYCSGGCGATKSLVDSYLKDNGSPLSASETANNSTLYSSLQNVAANRDPRLAQTIFIDDGKHYVWEKASPPRLFAAPFFDGWDADESCATGYAIYKGHNYRYATSNYDEDHNALIYFRYGEVLLIYTEAKAELGSITQADLDKSINKLRSRVGMPDMSVNVSVDNNFEFSTLTPIIQAIRRERKVELAMEGFRVDDIMRWAAAGELIVGKTPVGALKSQWENFSFATHNYGSTEVSRQGAFDERVALLTTNGDGFITFTNVDRIPNGLQFKENRDYLYPIPTNQKVLNPALGQNPGW